MFDCVSLLLNYLLGYSSRVCRGHVKQLLGNFTPVINTPEEHSKVLDQGSQRVQQNWRTTLGIYCTADYKCHHTALRRTPPLFVDRLLFFNRAAFSVQGEIAACTVLSFTNCPLVNGFHILLFPHSPHSWPQRRRHIFYLLGDQKFAAWTVDPHYTQDTDSEQARDFGLERNGIWWWRQHLQRCDCTVINTILDTLLQLHLHVWEALIFEWKGINRQHVGCTSRKQSAPELVHILPDDTKSDWCTNI